MKLFSLLLAFWAIHSCSPSPTVRTEVKMDLSGRQLSQIPDSVFKHTDLTYLDLGSREVTFYPPLSVLVDSHSNQITALPDKIGELRRLKTLILNTNNLTSLPDEITKLSNLEILDVSINRELDIVQQLDKLKQLPKLKVLKIVDVKMTKEQMDQVQLAFPNDTKIIMNILEYLHAAKQ